MARGGVRPGGGRPRGARNKRTLETIEKAESAGLMPLDYLLSVLRDDSADREMRMDAAAKAAPYVHARLVSSTVRGDADNPLRTISRVESVIVDPANPDS